MTSSRVSKADRLRRAAESQALVRIKRSPRNADRVDGIVVAVGSKWALIAHTGDGGFFEGLVAIRTISPLLAIEQETRFHSQLAWIGVVDEVTKRRLWLYDVRPNATWRKRPLGYKLRRITKVFISDRYLTALAAIAGTAPTH
jgi:hypothetical protein